MDHLHSPNITSMMELRQATSQSDTIQDCAVIYDEPSNRLSIYTEVKNEAYRRYERHTADKDKRDNSVQDLDYQRPL